jgi:hypothetical protein
MVISHIASEYLHLSAQPSKRRAVDDAIPIALIGSAIRMNRFGMLATARIGAVHRVRGE